MKVLVIGSGGREHALCWSLKQQDSIELLCAPGNAGIAQIARCVNLGPNDLSKLADLGEQEGVDLTIVGGEAPLAAGLVDEFEARGLLVAGPRQEAAKLESSKAFAKDFMHRHRIPTARHRVAASVDEVRSILKNGEFGGSGSGVVVKADGLAAGKGVVVANNHAEAVEATVEMMEGGRVGDAASRVVIEEAMTGREASLLLWTDGTDYVLMPPARDHKRVGENDTGPNTGGMGAVTSPDILDDALLGGIVRDIVEPTLEGTRTDQLDFRGVLFIGLMLTSDGPKVLEYNVRFGDPETQAILVRLNSSLVDIFEAVARRRLGQINAAWNADPSACVVLAAPGYPEKPRTGARISGLDEAAALPSVQVFHAGTSLASDGAFQTAGGRVLGVTSTGPTLDDALGRCYEAASKISWEGIHYRRDIGRTNNPPLNS